jgi:membrane protein YqaA with SNARE-associated domain
MTLDDTEPTAPESAGKRTRGGYFWRFALGLVLLLGGVVLLVRTLRPELEGVGKWFFERFGLLGVAAGTFIADGFHFPVPPQFYMLLATAANSDPLTTLAASSAGSVLGGGTGYLVARQLGHVQALRRWIERLSRDKRELIGERHPYRSALVASMTPIAFSLLCYAAGLLGIRRGPVLFLLLMRVPKIALYYYLVKIGWSLS